MRGLDADGGGGILGMRFPWGRTLMFSGSFLPSFAASGVQHACIPAAYDFTTLRIFLAHTTRRALFALELACDDIIIILSI